MFREEVEKFLKAQLIKEVKYSTWLANVIMVKKANGKWHICIDCTNLNKACPKDVYPLPSIDKLVDGASRFQLLIFLDVYLAYDQIRIHLLDEEKTASINKDANFCYKVMPFRLKKAVATYQRLMDWVFKQQIVKNVEVYIDDMIIKSLNIAQHVADLEEVFREIHKYDMCLNPRKCTFGVGGGKFLGFMITHHIIEANPDKCTTILEMHSLTNVREVQKLNGRLMPLSRFFLRLAEKAKPFYKLLRKLSHSYGTKLASKPS